MAKTQISQRTFNVHRDVYRALRENEDLLHVHNDGGVGALRGARANVSGVFRNPFPGDLTALFDCGPIFTDSDSDAAVRAASESVVDHALDSAEIGFNVSLIFFEQVEKLLGAFPRILPNDDFHTMILLLLRSETSRPAVAQFYHSSLDVGALLAI
jgi:hypothetical protein